MKEKTLANRVWNQIQSVQPEELAKINVNALARLNGVSVPNLSRAFKKYFDFKLSTYLKLKKMRAFETIIKNNPYMTIKSALDKLDIQSSSNFGIRYKKYRSDGMPPSYLVLESRIEHLQKLRHKR